MTNVINPDDFYTISSPIVKLLVQYELELSGLFQAKCTETIGGYLKTVKSLKWSKTGITEEKGVQLSAGDKEAFVAALAKISSWPEAMTISALERGADRKREWFECLPADDMAKIGSAPFDYRFPYLNKAGELVCFVWREDVEGGKRFHPLTPHMFNDRTVWVHCWPETPLLFGAETLKEALSSVLIVEGERKAIFLRLARELHLKAATSSQKQAIESLVSQDLYKRLERFPWAQELPEIIVSPPNGVHNVSHADWSLINRNGDIETVYFWPDSDIVGRDAIPTISKALNKRLYTIEVDSSIIGSKHKWDCVDGFGDNNYSPNGTYIGKPIISFFQNSTWMTDLVQVEESKEIPVLRNHVQGDFVYLYEDEQFADVVTGELFDATALNKKMNRFSHTKNVADLLNKDSSAGNVATWCFKPKPLSSIMSSRLNENLINIDGKQTFNTFRPFKHKAVKGDLTEFKEFMTYMVPDGEERKHLLEWAATIVAKPEYRVIYAALLYSRQTGVGKGTFGQHILTPLVGKKYVEPARSEDLNRFLNWAFSTRLAIFDEFFVANNNDYNRLKNLITESQQVYEAKGVDAVKKETQVAILGTYNPQQGKPFLIDKFDRRFLVINCAEKTWTEEPQAKWDHFYTWLETGGLEAIAYLFQNITEYTTDFEWCGASARFKYVPPGAKSPSTKSKDRLIEENIPEAKRNLIDLAEIIKEHGDNIVIPDRVLLEYAGGEITYKKSTVVNIMRENNLFVSSERKSVRFDTILAPVKCYLVSKEDPGERPTIIKDTMKLKEALKLDDAI